MRRHSLGLSTVYLLLLSGLLRAEPAANLPPAREVRELATRIDQLTAAAWTARNVTPAEPADDATFFRRVYLDLAGRIPRVTETRAFLDDPSPDKRQRLVERLLEGPYFVKNFTAVWRSQMLPPTNNIQLQFVAAGFDAWLQARLLENVPYDRLVREVLTTPVNFGNNQRAAFFGGGPNGNPTPLAFYQANEMKPENIAASVSRMFLGVKLECAQCHDHPFASWKRQQFWEFAAFFAGIGPQGPNNGFAAAPEKAQQREIKIPGTEKTVQARFLNGTEPAWKTDASTREALADWLTSPDNPFFARAVANRLWAHFFGIGLIEPVDEPGDENPPSHPEVLDELAQQLAAHHFDLKFLIRAIVNSQTYQRSSAAAGSSPDEPRLFARMALKGLTPEQLFDSLVTATGFKEQPNPNQRFSAFGIGTTRSEFLSKFSSQEKRTESQTSILQALALMNGKFIADATDLSRSEVLAGILDAPFLDTSIKKIETLYLATLNRRPRPDELTRLVKYAEDGGTQRDTRAALADICWALLNSPEFRLNH